MFYSNVLEQVVDSIARFSDRNAFCIANRFYTYQEFGQQISSVRTALHNAQHINRKVGLVINDDIQTYASIFALWMEGECYVPLHPHWPKERCLDICSQVEIDLILDSSEGSRYSDANCLVLNTSALSFVEDNLVSKASVSDEELAYVLFTSGSTGRPKGVPLTRRNLASFANAFFCLYSLDENDRCLQCFDLSFDLSIMSYLIPLLRGACVYVVSSEGVKYVQIGSLIERHKLTFALMAPSTIKYLQPYFDEMDCSSLKVSLFCGEALHLDVTEKWAQCASNAIIENVYGPTEDTIWCSTYRFNRQGVTKAYNGVISIGKPMKNCGMAIFDENQNICKTGDLGELCLSGEQLTPGYLNNPEKNAAAFFIKDGVRWYRTGDLCFQDEDGDIMYSGRLDHQAKIQGFRVEMGEIEFHAREYLAGPNVVCLAYDNKEGLTEIAMFIESEKQPTDKLIAYMKTKMPIYMIPTKVYFVPIFQLNGNAKIDKNILKAMIK